MLALERVLAPARPKAKKAPRMLIGNPADYLYNAADPRRVSQARHSVYVKIAEGCSRRCSFCAIPSFRGTQRSRPITDVVAEVTRLCAAGTVEANVISQDTVRYGRDLKDGTTLEALVEALEDVPGLRWLRLFYLYPDAVTDRLLAQLGAGRKLVPYVDMPMQHTSDAMLKRMRRGYSSARQRELLERMRTAVPELSIRTAFIVGHPGETDADFQALCDFVREQRFDHVGVFRYSNEESTHSFELGGQVEPEVIDARAEQLMAVQREVSRALLQKRVGQTLEVLVEGVSDESELLLQGRHKGQAPEVDGVVLLTDDTAQPGDVRRARVKQAADYDLVAKLLPEPGARAPRVDGAEAGAGKRRTRLPLVT
jgi:ribosomal protein S12 methylthiotransferase